MKKLSSLFPLRILIGIFHALRFLFQSKNISLKVWAGVPTFALLALGIPLLLWGLPGSSTAQAKSDHSLLEPADVLALYWKASLDGDSKTFRELISDQKINFYDSKCATLQLTSDNATVPKVTIETTAHNLNPKKPPVKLFGELEKYSVPELVFSFSHFLNVNKIQISDYSLAKQDIYQDEALLELTLKRDPQDDNTKIFFLKKEEEGWKIFNIYSKSVLSLVGGTRNFGERGGCE